MPINVFVLPWSKVKVGDRRENTSSHPERIEGAHRTMAERRTLAAYLNRIPAPLLVFLGGGIGAFCRIHTPGGVLAANLIGSFTLGLLTALWASHARIHGEDAVRPFRFLFGAGMMGGYTTYSSIAAVTSQAVFINYTVHGWYVLLSLAVLFIGGLAAAGLGLFMGGKIAARWEARHASAREDSSCSR
ncbi:CrcB-like protein [Rothia dentocariosa ATCC 17931]|uniref:Fluoride-specific ion channel n=1 Tax=Rothia dentocariosa (strain ATCC 17931 / CDC X599 / XDIA) TaxID=762948 RepID=E3H2Q0_ROTDC|nr:CrcB family protein [Rothia dentocariosa]ADP40319.1 CrcB-like protein [Rothia dentocariosa ATCC 17931]